MLFDFPFYGHYTLDIEQGEYRALISPVQPNTVNAISDIDYSILEVCDCVRMYMSQMLYAGQSAREIVTFLSNF